MPDNRPWGEEARPEELSEFDPSPELSAGLQKGKTGDGDFYSTTLIHLRSSRSLKITQGGPWLPSYRHTGGWRL